MAAPNDGYGQYPPQEYGQQAPYSEQPAEGYENPASPPLQTQAQHAADQGRKKKRAYAAGAFDVGAGANAAAGGQVQGGGQFGAPQPVAPGYGGYPQPDAQPAGYAAPQPSYGLGQPVAPAGGAPGYPAPEPFYPSSGAPPAPGGVQGITSGVSNMQLGSGAQPAQQAPPQARAGPLNQLYPTDLLNQPFNVSELDLPPPPIILPPNVSVLPSAVLVSKRAVAPSHFALADTLPPLVKRHFVAGRQLLPQVRALDPQRRADDAFTSQEEQASFRARHTAICGPP